MIKWGHTQQNIKKKRLGRFHTIFQPFFTNFSSTFLVIFSRFFLSIFSFSYLINFSICFPSTFLPHFYDRFFHEFFRPLFQPLFYLFFNFYFTHFLTAARPLFSAFFFLTNYFRTRLSHETVPSLGEFQCANGNNFFKIVNRKKKQLE